MNSYFNLLNIKYKKSILIFVIWELFWILIIILCITDSYDIRNYNAIYQDNLLIVSVPLQDSDKIQKGKFALINKEKYDYRVQNISELKNINKLNYQDFYVKTKYSGMQNEVVKITFYYNKEKTIKKIINFIF